MKILLTGRDGQVGFELQRALAPLGELTALGHTDCDLGDAQALRAAIADIAPDVIVNAAAYTAVDRAEHERDAAFAINAVAPGVMGEEAERLGALVVHYSTDYVFDGRKGAPYVESDPTGPLNVYGQSKLAGELALANATRRHLILRTSWVLGVHGNNFARTMLRLCAQRERMEIVDDQRGAPTSAALVANVTAHAIGRLHLRDTAPALYGTYHLAASGDTTWHGYARHVIEAARAAGHPVKVRPDAILPVSSAHFPGPAMRPANSLLDTTRLRQAFDIGLPHWRDGVDQVLQQIL